MDIHYCLLRLGENVFAFEIIVLQVLQGLEAATSCVEDMDEWLGIFNLKLRHMREDIESVGISAFHFCSLLSSISSKEICFALLSPLVLYVYFIIM